MYRSPNDVYIDEWVYELLDLVETTGATRVLIDSLSDLHYAATDPVRFREFIYSLTQRLSRSGISPIMTSEVPDLFHVGRLAEYGISHLSDNVILLQYVRADTRLLRTVTVVKSRASAHDPEIREFDITSDGIILGDPIGDENADRSSGGSEKWVRIGPPLLEKGPQMRPFLFAEEGREFSECRTSSARRSSVFPRPLS